MDIDEIAPGSDFAEVLTKNLQGCGAFIAVIGPHWLAEQDTNGARRLDSENDFVRLEVRTALRSGIPVIPVLVDGAELPAIEDLPDDLKPLVKKQAVELSHRSFNRDANALAARLKAILSPTSLSQYLTMGIIGAFAFCTFYVLTAFLLATPTSSPHWYFVAVIAALLAYPTTRYFVGMIRWNE